MENNHQIYKIRRKSCRSFHQEHNKCDLQQSPEEAGVGQDKCG